MNASTYVRNITVRRNATFVYCGKLQTGLWILDGKNYSEEQFDEMFPITAVKIKPYEKYSKGLNQDSTKHWLN